MGGGRREEGVSTGMNNEVGVYARKSRRHRRSEFLAFAFLFLSRLFRGVRWSEEQGGNGRLSFENDGERGKKSHVKYATIFLRRSDF